MALLVLLGVVVGSACALFLWLLDRAIHLQITYGWLLFLLPLAGLAVGWVYAGFGRPTSGGNNLIFEEIETAGRGVPKRMAPLILFSTVVTHLFGGSAGREGTAVQMGGSLASTLAQWFRVDAQTKRTLLIAGVAAGFGAVFGTPLAGALFAVEVLVLGRLQWAALLPALVASLVADYTCMAWGSGHTDYRIGTAVSVLDWQLWPKLAVAGVAFGLAGRLFAEVLYAVEGGFKRWVSWAPLRPVIGGLLVIGLVWLLGTRDYLCLGDWSRAGGVSIHSAFDLFGATPWSWWWKILFTAVTLGSGFKGGEVTPLFFIGATLGNTMALLLGAPVDLFAGVGFVAVFASAANTPLACCVMGAELFGVQYLPFLLPACYLAYYASGHSGIYLSQRVAVPKWPSVPKGITLREARLAGRKP